MVVSVTPAQYFSRKRGFANGVVYAAGGLGGTIISFALNGLISSLGTPWTYRVIGFITLATGLPSAYLIKERAPITATPLIDKSLLRDRTFIVLFFAGALATFPLFVPPFFLPLYSNSMGLSNSAGAGLVAGFNFSSAVGRLLLGLNADFMGPLNTLLVSLIVSGISMLVIWPFSNSIGPLIAFVIINGMANGGFFAVMPTVVGAVFGSRRVSVAMGMIGKTYVQSVSHVFAYLVAVTGWTGGYLLGAPIAGFMLAAYGPKHGGPISLTAYHPAIFYAGSMALAASALVAFVRFNSSLSLKKRI